MGDLLNNSKMLKKLGFDGSKQWIIYDQQFEKFFNFLFENVTDANIFKEQELLERDEMMARGECMKESERQLKMKQIESENPGLLTYTPQDLEALTAELEVIAQAINDYSELIQDMQNSKQSLNNTYSQLDLEFQHAEREVLIECQSKARQLEELQRENCKLSEENNKAFTLQHVPQLFMHQLPLEQYFLKCDSFMQYFTLYMKDTFKIQDYDFDGDALDMQHINNKLESLQNSIQFYKLAYMKEKAKAKATQGLIDHVDLNHVHSFSLVDIERETQELQLLNDNHLKNTYDTLIDGLTIHIQQHVQQHIETVLYENTKLKLERALRRRENDKQLTDIISKALSNAELIWISIQLDLEKKRNCTDSSVRLSGQAQASWDRVQIMRSLSAKDSCAQLLHEIAGHLSAHLGQTLKSAELKSCLYEYEKFGRLLGYSLQCMLNKMSHKYVHNHLANLEQLEQTLRPFVYDSPLEQPMFENLQYMCLISNAVDKQFRLENSLRHLRSKFQDTIKEPMERETLWRYSNLLWIWFLTEPLSMIHAIDEVKKSSAKIPALTSSNFRSSGMLRK